MSFNANIPDMLRYNTEMRKSLVDKIFFIDKIDADVIVDYGCADGATIAFLRAIFPEKIYIGYDISEGELAVARTALPDVALFSQWDQLRQHVAELQQQGKRTAVVCNSLIHEVYSYGNADSVAVFWSQVFSEVFDYVVIRDMSVSRSATRQSDSLSVLRVRQLFDADRLNQFETTWGSINENWSLVHFLLKYRYEANWSREVRENYLPLNYEDLIRQIPRGWLPVFHEHFTLPFIRERAREDFGIDLQDRTHVKLIFKRA